MAVEFKIDTKDLEKKMRKLSQFPKEARKATSSAINRTLTFTAKKTGQEVRKYYNVKISEVKGGLTIRKANPGSLSGEIISRDRRLSLGRFVRGKSKKAVKVRVKKTTKKVTVDPSAFVVNIGGNRHVAKRTSDTRYPIEVLRTVSIPQMISSKNVQPGIQKEAGEYLAKRAAHEIDYQIKKNSREVIN